MKAILKLLLAAAMALPVGAQAKATAAAEIKPVPFTKVHVNDKFWRQRLDTLQHRTIRYAFQKCTEAGYLENFKLAGDIIAGRKNKGDVRYQSGTTYDDAEVYKVIEGASYLLNVKRDEALEQYVDSVINLICAAQEPDGYVFTNWTIGNPLHEWLGGVQWKNDWNLSHETFDMGELIEAAVAYYQATGKDKFLKTAIRCADLICRTYRKGGLDESPGHAVVEMALVRLYEVTRNRKYLDECKFFIDCRGSRKFDSTQKDYRKNGMYWQNHMPAVKQREATGHAVRAMYLYSGMADWARYAGDKEMEQAVDAIWNNIESKKLYITGGLGARDHDESFGDDYELPNATAYCETCASVAGCMFNLRMFRLHGEAKYIDFIERALYNNVLDGISVSGDHFFYPNRLETSRRGNRRSEWFGTSCCPTNLTRLIPSMPGYVYATQGNTLFVNLFVSSTSDIPLGKNSVVLTQQTGYPWDGAVNLKVEKASGKPFCMKLRIPGWAMGEPVASGLYTYAGGRNAALPVLKVNGEQVQYALDNGYAVVERAWKSGDEIALSLPMNVRQVKANPMVKDDEGLLSVERGPIVYCAEFADNGGKVSDLAIPEGTHFYVKHPQSSLFADIRTIEACGTRAENTPDGVQTSNAQVTLVPYFSRSHRGKGEMRVWIPTEAKLVVHNVDYIDNVWPSDDESESEHQLKGENMRNGDDQGWRDSDGGWFSYTLKVDSARPCDLVLKYSGDDGGNRKFDIYADGVKIATEHVDFRLPTQYVERHYAVPTSVTKGKNAVTFKFVAQPGNIVGGLFGAKTVLSGK